MGGLRRALPVTFVTMTIGLAALAGVPPLAGSSPRTPCSGRSRGGDARRAAAGRAAWLAAGRRACHRGAHRGVRDEDVAAGLLRPVCRHGPGRTLPARAHPTPPGRGARPDALAAGGARGPGRAGRLARAGAGHLGALARRRWARIPEPTMVHWTTTLLALVHLVLACVLVTWAWRHVDRDDPARMLGRSRPLLGTASGWTS